MMTQKKSKRYLLLLSMFILGLIALVLLQTTKSAHAAAFVVTLEADDSAAHDHNPGDGVCADFYNVCTFRAAIEESNALPGTDTITFAYGMTITVGYGMGDWITTDAVAIDASSVWDTVNDQPGVVLDGQGVGNTGIIINSSNTSLTGLHITNFSQHGIELLKSGNSIGGPYNNQRNVITNNGNVGIYLNAGSQNHTMTNLVQNSYIGVMPDGLTAAPNGIGVKVHDHNAIIGERQPSLPNVISGNASHALVLEGQNTTNNQIGYNIIGLGFDQITDVPNDGIGILLADETHNNIIGLVDGKMAYSYIAFNRSHGILLENSHQNEIYNGAIYRNDGNGIYLRQSSSQNYLQANSLSENSEHGILGEGGNVRQNTFRFNNIADHNLAGISLVSGSNDYITAPLILTATTTAANGVSSCAFCYIELFFDSHDEGTNTAGTTWTDASGNWSYSGSLVDPHNNHKNLTATVTDSNNNTSEFSPPMTIVP